MTDTARNVLGGVVLSKSSNNLFDADHIAKPTKYCPIGNPVVNTAMDILLWVPDTPIIVRAASFIPSIAVAENDTNYISLALSKGDLAAGSLTVVGTAFNTTATGQVGDLAARTEKSWTIVTASSTNYCARGTGLYLIMTKGGTGPAWGGTVKITYDLQG